MPSPVPKAMQTKIGSLNLCLGLSNKKDLIKNIIKDEKIDILCLQETELEINFDHNLMSFSGYFYESETNDFRSRVGCYVKSDISYIRRQDLEGLNSHLIILDIMGPASIRIINIYRCFKPQNNISAMDLFKYQMDLIHSAYNENTVVLGDINLDWAKKGQKSYQFQKYFDYMDEKFCNKNFMQVVDFPTWSRNINGVLKESTLDHIYTQDPTSLIDLYSVAPCFGDHLLLIFGLSTKKIKKTAIRRRSWINYSREALCKLIQQEDWTIEDDTVQGTWNLFENKLVNILDILIPMRDFTNNNCKTIKSNPVIKNKLNVRKRLLKLYKTNKSNTIKEKIKVLDKVIKTHFHSERVKDVRRSIVPGSSQSLWRAVKIAKDVNTTALPSQLYWNNAEINSVNLPDAFACFFDSKIRNVINEVEIDNTVYNGKKLVNTNNSMFMTPEAIRSCMLSLKPKNSEGLDRIPQRVLRDGIDFLLPPLTRLFYLIYNLRQVPDQWLIAKTTPIYKNKGERQKVENYRPIANLCSTSKIFEKLILKRILDIQDQNSVDLTNKGQHGFKLNRSTSTLSAELVSMIARSLDNDEFALVSSLDLSAAFDVVDIDLLLKRLEIVGLPEDLISLIKVWLKNRSYYVSIDGENSVLHDLLLGTVQGSVLGPVLYAMFVSPVFDIVPMLAFADDSYRFESGADKTVLVAKMERSLKTTIKWLQKSGLKVNNEKTDMCLFYKHDTTPVIVKVGELSIRSKKEINVLGVTLDSKLQWSSHVANAIQKSSKSLNAIKLLVKYFNKNELLQILTSNFYSTLYYNAEIWLSESLSYHLKKQLLSASGRALRVAMHYPDPSISFIQLHRAARRATPVMFGKYRLAIQLYKTFNNRLPETEWLYLNYVQTNTTRQVEFNVVRSNNLLVGLNILSNKFHELNGTIPLEWFNSSLTAYKLLCKTKFLTFED